jgi:hypothetical protein
VVTRGHDQSSAPPNQINAELAKAGFVLHTMHEFLPRQMFLVFTVK